MFGGEASAIIAGGGGIGNPLGAEGVEKGRVVAAQFDVLEARAITEGVDGEVKDVVGIGVRQVQFEQMQALINGVAEADVLGEFMEQGDAAEGGAIDALIEFEMKVAAAAKDGLGAIGEFGFVEASPDGAFARVEFLAEDAVAFARGVLAVAAVLPLASGGLLV